MKTRPRRPLAGLLIALGLAATLAASWSRADDRPPDAYNPDVKTASPEGRQAIARFKVPAGLKVELFAAEPLLANPVAFAVDERNRFYVAETFRHGRGVTDTRNHMNWLDDDLAARTVADRVAMYRKFLRPDEFDSFGVEHDRIRLVADRDGDGVAETATVFADGFKDHAVGIGAGVLARGDTVWYANIPDLWLLRDTDGDGRADQREALHSGYGVHVGFLGHDLHGLQFGPDGRLYFSIGDRGLNVTTKEGKPLVHLDSGAVLRCEPDGSGLELFATGLRNPQELAFNEYGDLFTCDNNSDSGDRARWVHLVYGGDSGWRIGYQFIERPNSRGPWNAEKLWHPQPENTAAYLLPPIANLSDGPSGLTYHPGTAALPDDARGTFYLADFRGAAGTSGVRSIRIEPKGASYKLVDQRQYLWGLEATDVDFGTDGALYVTDWVQGWDKTGKGRIYRLCDPSRSDDPTLAEVRSLLAEGMAHRTIDECSKLLAHADQRVRREAQYELARRSRDDPKAAKALERVATDGPERFGRIHAIWAIGQVARQTPARGAVLVGLLGDTDAEIRTQAARALADAGQPAAGSVPKLVGLLRDESPRARFQAAMALAFQADRGAIEPILAMIRENAGRDVYLRHAGVMALAKLGDEPALLSWAGDPDRAVRLALLLALRRQGSPEAARFLTDADPLLCLEAARAIHDRPIAEALPALASRPVSKETAPAIIRRIIAANLRLGEPANAEALVAIASNGGVPDSYRIEALEALADWPRPPGRDRVLGLWRPIAERPASPAAEALRPRIVSLLSDDSERVRRIASRAASQLGVKEAAPALRGLLADRTMFSATRIEALRGLERLKDEGLADAAATALDAEDPDLRGEALRILADVRPAVALPHLRKLLESGSIRERQRTLATLGTIQADEADALLASLLDELTAGRVAPEIRLDLIEAARQRDSGSVQQRLAAYEASRSRDDPLAAYREALVGGDSRQGRTIFREKLDVYCIRCHKISGEGGEVGPDLTGIGGKQSREYLLESIILPSQKIAEGFDTVMLALNDGQVVAGVLKGEDERQIRLMTPEGQLRIIAKSDVEDRQRGASAMPEDLAKKLTPREVRDLVEFLAGSR
jgi:quinoprotein glucose dehydrogenase